MSNLFFDNNTMDMNTLWYNSHLKLIRQITRELNVQDRHEELAEKFLGKPMKIKKRKDPDMPKKPLSSFLFFCSDNRENVRKNEPDLSMGGVMKELGKKWKTITDKQRVKYDNQAKEAKVIYDDKMEQYKLNH